MADIHESLAEKLRSLGVQTGTKAITPPHQRDVGIEDVVEGKFIETTFGEVFYTEILCDNVYTHGVVELVKLPISKRFINWADSSVVSDNVDLSTTLFLDTETTGLSGGTGTIPFMVGLGRFTADGFLTSQIFIRNPSEEQAQLELLDRLLTGVTAIVTYNGKAFDAPILKTRYVLNGLPSPLNNLMHFDLLPLSRRLWKRRLDSRSLKDIESEILKFSRDQIEVPGWEIPVLYFNYLRTGDATPLAGVFYHNCIDIQSLAALFLLMNQMAEEPVGGEKESPLDMLSLAVQYETTGDFETAKLLFERLLHEDLPEVYRTEMLLRYSRILKRDGDFIRASHVLQTGQSQKDIRVMIQLAKILEHQDRDYLKALEYTNIALAELENADVIISSRYFMEQKNDLLKRRNRLLQKISLQGIS